MQSLVTYCVPLTICYLMIYCSVHSLEFTKRHNDDTIIDIKKTHLCDYMGGPKALGMETGDISDDDISASSAYNKQSVGPQNARLNREISGGAWCPSKQLNSIHSGSEWIQVDLRDKYVITGVATQGRFGNGVGVEFAEEFWLEYSRDNGSTWNKWTDIDGKHKLSGNSDTYTIVTHVLSHPLVGINLIRIVPFASHQRTTCLRFEIYGCKQNNLPIRYSMPDGFKSGKFGDLVDMTYDGNQDNNRYLFGGIGQLVDGILGDNNYKINKGFEWIGWRGDGEPNDGIQIIFEFENQENFTSATFYCHNLFKQDMEVFSSANIWFSFDGKVWSKRPVEFFYMADNALEEARDVIIHLHHRIGKFIKFDLKFAKKWILISEVSFELSPLEENYTGSTMDLETPFETITPITTVNTRDPSSFKEFIVLIVFALVFTVIFSASIVLLRLHMRRKEKSGHIVVCMKDLATTPLYCEPKDVNSSRSSSANDPDYAVPDVAQTNNNANNNNLNAVNTAISQSPIAKTPILTPKGLSSVNPLLAQRYYASTDVIKSPKISNSLIMKRKFSNGDNDLKMKYSNGINDTIIDLKCIPQLSEDQIMLIRSQFGSSKFGELSIGKYKYKVRSGESDESLLDETLVVLKALRNENLRNEFYHEMKSKWFISAKSERIAKLFGYISNSDYTAMVLEVGDCDLNHFLRNCDNNIIGYSSLIYMASEVASALKYLETLGYVHKDIAARNILVYTSNLTIKIGDSGAHALVNKNDYIKGMAIRWASPEALLHGIFTNKSDVYSFGVTFWEILTYCSLKPFHNLDDQSFLKAFVSIHEQTANIDCTNNKAIYYHPFGDGSDQRVLALPRPEGCPKEIYDLLLECWQTSDVSRPTFREISLFLNRKTIGFQKPQIQNCVV